MSLICPYPKRFLQFCSSEGVVRVCVVCVCASIIWLSLCPRGHIDVRREKEEKKEKLVCLCLLSLASNWIFCPEFSDLCVEVKAWEGYTSERSRTFYVSPSHLRNKKTSPDWKDQNTCLQLCIHPCKGTSHHITPFSASVKCVGLRCFCWLKEENQKIS